MINAPSTQHNTLSPRFWSALNADLEQKDINTELENTIMSECKGSCFNNQNNKISVSDFTGAFIVNNFPTPFFCI